jgi:hypothetical protein
LSIKTSEFFPFFNNKKKIEIKRLKRFFHKTNKKKTNKKKMCLTTVNSINSNKTGFLAAEEAPNYVQYDNHTPSFNRFNNCIDLDLDKIDFTKDESQIFDMIEYNSDSQDFACATTDYSSSGSSYFCCTNMSCDCITSEQEHSLMQTSSSSSSIPGIGHRKQRKNMYDKKESNRLAALKYRSKKVQQRQVLFEECQMYKKRIEEMKSNIEKTLEEISNMKSMLLQKVLMEKMALHKN